MGNGLTKADLALVQAAIDEANASMGRALAVIENAAAQVERKIMPCAGCGGVDDGCGTCPLAMAEGSCGCPRAGDCVACGEPSGRVIGSGGFHAQD